MLYLLQFLFYWTWLWGSPVSLPHRATIENKLINENQLEKTLFHIPTMCHNWFSVFFTSRQSSNYSALCKYDKFSGMIKF